MAIIFSLVSIGTHHRYLLRQQANSDDDSHHPSFRAPRVRISARNMSITKKKNNNNTRTRSTTNNTVVSTNETNNNNNKKKKKKWAYAFLMAGVDPNDTSENGKWYHGILFNVMVSAELLYGHHSNTKFASSSSSSSKKSFKSSSSSKADVILMVQLSKDSNATKLTDEEENWLQRANVKIKYLPLPYDGRKVTPNFYTVQFEKFRILQYHQEYSRILFMDGDVMPHCNLDYLFELSERGVLKENIVLAWRREPVSGGFFMMTPHKGDYEAIEKIIEHQQYRALETGVIFDPIEGWGHKITPPDSWISTKEPNGTEWSWHGDFVDQGLLYYWVKYLKKNVSIILFDKIQQWGDGASIVASASAAGVGNNNNNEELSSSSSSVTLESTLYNNEPFKSFDCTCRPGNDTPENGNNSNAFFTDNMLLWPSPPTNLAPFRDFVHFSGMNKPWSSEQQKRLNLTDIIRRVEVEPTASVSSSSSTTMITSQGTDDSDNMIIIKSIDPSGFRNPQEIWQYTFWKVFERLGMVSDGTTNSGDNHDNTEGSINKLQLQQHHLKVFHKRLEISGVKYGGFPTYWHAMNVIRERFGQNDSHIGFP